MALLANSKTATSSCFICQTHKGSARFLGEHFGLTIDKSLPTTPGRASYSYPTPRKCPNFCDAAVFKCGCFQSLCNSICHMSRQAERSHKSEKKKDNIESLGHLCANVFLLDHVIICSHTSLICSIKNKIEPTCNKFRKAITNIENRTQFYQILHFITFVLI